jgi:hypothetical protein
MKTLKMWIVAVVVNLILSLVITVAGVYAMVQTYGWAIIGWMFGLAAFTTGVQWATWHFAAQSNNEMKELDAAVERAHKHSNGE